MSTFRREFVEGFKQGWADASRNYPRWVFLPFIWPCEVVARAAKRLFQKLAARS